MDEGPHVTDTTPERWRRIKQIASAALELEESARAAYLDAACAGDSALNVEVRSLLASTVAAMPYFESDSDEIEKIRPRRR